MSQVRTSRVHFSAEKVFRNSNRPFHSDIDFNQLFKDGGKQHFGQQQGKQNKKKENRHPQTLQKKVFKNTPKNVIVKGLQLDGDSIELINNRLIERSTKITDAQNRISRLRTYRTSI